MIHAEPRTQILAVCLAGIAGYVDAVGFISLGGFFVSFMSGNSTRFGVGVVESLNDALIALALIATFVAGVAVGSLIRSFSHKAPGATVVGTVSGLLACAGVFGAFGFIVPAAFAMTLAMGAENTIFERRGEIRIGLTYLTGTLVKLGQSLAALLRGERDVKWLPYLFHWVGLVCGAIVGAALYKQIEFYALILAAIGMASLVPIMMKSGD